MSTLAFLRRPGAFRAAAAVAAATALAACGNDPTGPGLITTPSPTSFTAQTPVAGTIATTARAWYGDTVLTFEREVFYWEDRVNWAAQQAAIRPRVSQARTFGDLWGAAEASIDPWLRQAGDEHSAYFPPTDAPGVVDAPAQDTRFLVSGTTLPAATGAAPLAYLWLPTYTGKNDEGRADSTQRVISTLDQSSPCGWVLDLRFNPGGTFSAMMAGINPIFGDAPASNTAGQNGYGGLVDKTDARLLLYLQGGDAGLYDPESRRRYSQVKTSTNYTLRRPNSPVALLIGPLTASAGELITLGYRGGPVPARSFGEPTYGVTTTPFGVYLRPDSGYLNITGGVMFDRTGQLYGGKLQPDELVTGYSCRASSDGGCPLARQNFGATYTRTSPTPSAEVDPTLRAAMTWLRAQPACTNAPAAQRGPSFSREAAAAARLPGQVKPGLGAERVSPFFVPRTWRELVSR
jgi:hypothetical protein